MNQLQERIAQYRKMANDDPDNELGHYRLGQLLMEAEQPATGFAVSGRAVWPAPTPTACPCRPCPTNWASGFSRTSAPIAGTSGSSSTASKSSTRCAST